MLYYYYIYLIKYKTINIAAIPSIKKYIKPLESILFVTMCDSDGCAIKSDRDGISNWT